MALGLTQHLAEMSTRNISWGIKAAGAFGWQPYNLDMPIVLKSDSLILLDPSRPVHARNGIALSLPLQEITNVSNFFYVIPSDKSCDVGYL
jgi:hypothetical protein